MTHHRKIDLSMFRDDDEDDLIIAPKGKVILPTISKSQKLTTIAPSRTNRSQKSDFQSWKVGKDKERSGEGSGREEEN